MDTYEVERKYRCEHAPIREALDDNEFTREATIDQADTYFDHPTRSFAVTDEALRLRTTEPVDGETSTTELTYKGPREGHTAKTRRELTTTVSSEEALNTILEALEFEAVATVEKRRERYVRGEDVVVLDTINELGSFVEVERETQATDIEAAERDLQAIATALGLDEARLVERTYLGMLLGDNLK